jgi:NAD(P)-dependent dehydrogenase (short-subunit alcohol dehydrogenase family)
LALQRAAAQPAASPFYLRRAVTLELLPRYGRPQGRGIPAVGAGNPLPAPGRARDCAAYSTSSAGQSWLCSALRESVTQHKEIVCASGVIQLTRYLASFLSPHGIRVNTLSPGAFPHEWQMQDSEFGRRLAAKAPLNRVGVPEDIKGAVALLCTGKTAGPARTTMAERASTALRRTLMAWQRA